MKFLREMWVALQISRKRKGIGERDWGLRISVKYF